MSFKVIVMPLAKADLEDYADWIAMDSLLHSHKWLSDAWTLIFSLQEMPLRFPVIAESDEIGQQLRGVLHYSHRIIYRVIESEQTVEIIRVWHASRLPKDFA